MYQRNGYIQENCIDYLLLTAFGDAGEKRNRFVLVGSGGSEVDGLWVAKILLLFRMNVSVNSESRKYSFLSYMKVTNRIDTEDITLGFVCLRWFTDDEGDHSLE